MGRQRSAAVRYASKEAADSDKLLVKANRTLHVDVCSSIHSSSSSASTATHSASTLTSTTITRNIATAVGIQGWRKTMEDAHVVWLKKSNNPITTTTTTTTTTVSSDETDSPVSSVGRIFRSFVCGPIDCEHASTAATRRSSTATTALHADDSTTITPPTETAQQREASPAPALLHVHHHHQVLLLQPSSTSPSSSMMNSNHGFIDLLGDPALLPNSNCSNDGTNATTTIAQMPSSSSTTPSNNNNNNNNNHSNTTNISSEALSVELDQLSEGTSIEGFVAVFDGHGGDGASKFCSTLLGRLLFQEIARLNKNKNSNNSNNQQQNGDSAEDDFTEKELQQAFNKAFLECDDQLRNHFASIQNAEALERSMREMMMMNNNNNNCEQVGGATTSANNNRENGYMESYASPLLPGSTTNAGSTAAGALIFKNQIVLFSVGDCRSGVFCEKKKHHKTRQMQQEQSNKETANNTDDDKKKVSVGSSSSLSANQNNIINNQSSASFSGGGDDDEQQQKQQQQQNDDNDDENSFSSRFEMLGKLDQDHRPGASAIETERLQKMGVSVINGRVQGKLAVSRAFGDFSFKPLDGTSSSTSIDVSNPLFQFPVVCIPEIAVISRGRRRQRGHSSSNNNTIQSQNQSPSSRTLLIAIGCDGVFETQELKKLPDLVLTQIEPVANNNNTNKINNNSNGSSTHQPQRREFGEQGVSFDELNQEDECDEDEEEHITMNTNKQKMISSLSVHGTVKVAQRSISKIQPLSEHGGLLPGSDNVTFITVLLDEVLLLPLGEEHDDSESDDNGDGDGDGDDKHEEQVKTILISPREKEKHCC